ncbi:MAG: AAA family ATPase [Nitrosopumilus sp.]
MISSIELGDFLAHTETNLQFEDGVTVFVGHNGAGKSSIIDAITFALFGQHTRKSNKSLIKRGSNQGFARVRFSVNGKKYEATRKIDTKGTLSAKFSEIVGENQIEIAAGERKQFGESMTQEIEKTIGLDFEKLKIASIVQQGELNSIINAKPKEFKELINSIIGIDRLDVASDSMKIISKNFREKIRNKIGYDDTHIDILLRDLERCENENSVSKPKKIQLLSTQEKLQNEIKRLREKIETDNSKIDKINQLESRKKEILEYTKNSIKEIQQEINENERKIHDCENCFEQASLKNNLDSKMKKIEEAISDTSNKVQEMTNQIVSLKEKQALASKLLLKDNKCPVCDSVVEKLNPIFQEEHLNNEITTLQEKIILLEKEENMYTKKRVEFANKLQIAREAEATLKAYSINNKEELQRIQESTDIKKKNIQKIPLANENNLADIANIDSRTKIIFEDISKLEIETEGFDENEFLEIKKLVNEKQTKLSQLDQQIGAISENIFKNEKQIKTINNAISELKTVKEYMEILDKIQTNIFSRDGSVATSLRSWALTAISAKSSEYLSLLNTKIQRITLAEKIREISITCFSKNEVLEIESLSGGEKVSVALSLRLGMASLLGASNLNLMILDEPTNHLDAERKKSLVEVLSQLANISNSESPMQFLIITHDAEIFEDSTVEQIYKFDSSEQGSKVIVV